MRACVCACVRYCVSQYISARVFKFDKEKVPLEILAIAGIRADVVL